MQTNIIYKGTVLDEFSKLKTNPKNNTSAKNVIVVMAIKDGQQIDPSDNPNDKIKHYATNGEMTTTADT